MDGQAATAGPPWRLVLADDDASFRRVVRLVLGDYPNVEVVGEAADGAEAVEICVALQPDSVILDMKMPVMDGDKALAAIKERCPDTDVIALSAAPWVPINGPAPDAALEKGNGRWVEILPALVETLASDRARGRSSRSTASS